MEAERLNRIVAAVDGERDRGGDVGARLCAACVEVLEVSGAGIMLMVEGGHQGCFGASDAAARTVEDLQFALGEGPCIDALHTGRPVLEPDLGDPSVPRWPGFSGPAVEAGVRAVFAFPVRSGPGSVGLGALDVYRDRPGGLSVAQQGDAATLAALVARTVLAIQAGAPPGTLAAQLDAAVSVRAVVHQASGMVSAQLVVPVADALALIRAYAYARDVPVDDVARDIVGGLLRLDAGTG